VESIATAHRQTKGGRGRAQSATTRPNTISNLSQNPNTKSGKGARTASKRGFSEMDNSATDTVDNPPKRKASGLRSGQRMPSPLVNSDSDVFEDSKSAFSDVDDMPRVKPVTRAGRLALQSPQINKLTSEERETEDPHSTIYHSADDHRSSATGSTLMIKSKREMVNSARKEFEEEIWRDRVASGEVAGGSSEDDEKDNTAEEKGKKPTRTVRAKGPKGRKAKANAKKVTSQPEISEDESGSVGESHALVVKAMISPLRPGPVIADPFSEDSFEDGQPELINGPVTPVQSPERKLLSWSPATVEDVPSVPAPNGVLTEPEEEMTVEEWMRWVINDEVNRLEEECERLVRNLEKEGGRARRLLENLI